MRKGLGIKKMLVVGGQCIKARRRRADNDTIPENLHQQEVYWGCIISRQFQNMLIYLIIYSACF